MAAQPPDLPEDRFAEILERIDEDLREARSTSGTPGEAEFGERMQGAREVLELLQDIYPRQITSQPAELPAGLPTILGRYKLLRVLGGGGMGIVLEAIHTALKRRVALKVLKGPLAPAPHLISRFMREMEAVGRVDHPNVIRANDAGEEAGILFLAMDLVDGLTVQQLIETNRRISLPAACEIARQIACGLEAIWQKKLVHRDLKPSNVMVTPEGQVKILDLGLARLRDEEWSQEELTPSGLLMGTFDYQAPEQATKPRSVTIQADLYSLGCTIYKMLTGSVPFPKAKTPGQKIHAHANQPFPPLPETFPAPLRETVQKLTVKNPEQRWQSPATLAERLTEWSDPKDLRSLVEVSLAEKSASDRQTVHETPSIRQGTTANYRVTGTSRSRLLWIGLVVFCLLGLSAGVLFFANPWLKPSDGEQLRQLHLLEPRKNHDLLAVLPRLSPWSSQGDWGDSRYDSSQHYLRVDAPRISLFSLGKAECRDFDFSVLIHQTNWTDGPGIYLGFQESLIPDSKGIVWRTVETQILSIGTLQEGPDSPRRFTLARSHAIWRRSAGGEEKNATTRLAEVPIPTPIGEQALSIKVRRGGLEEVRLDNIPYPSLSNLVAGEPRSGLTGELGIVCVTCTANFRLAYFKMLDVP